MNENTGVSMDYYNEFDGASYCINSLRRGTMSVDEVYEEMDSLMENRRKVGRKEFFRKYEECYSPKKYNYNDPKVNKENIERLNNLVEEANKKYREGHLLINDIERLVDEVIEIIYGEKRY